MRKRRRIAIGVVLLLLAGVAINLAVAWTCVWRFSRDMPWANMSAVLPGDGVTWFWKPPRDIPVTDVQARYGFGVRFDERYALEGEPDVVTGPHEGRRTIQGQQLFRGGWPFMAFQWTDSYDGGPAKHLTAIVDAGRFMLVSWERGAIVWINPTKKIPYRHALWLPVMPSGVGFLINTLAYAAVVWGLWWLVVRAPRALRRRSRRRRDRCLECGYSLAGLTLCPECGGRSAGGAPQPA